MFVWAGANVPADMRDGLDYLLVSYYEDDCEGIQPDWQSVFDELAAMFPAAQLGIGECGTLKVSEKADYINRYYRDLTITHPRNVDLEERAGGRVLTSCVHGDDGQLVSSQLRRRVAHVEESIPVRGDDFTVAGQGSGCLAVPEGGQSVDRPLGVAITASTVISI